MVDGLTLSSAWAWAALAAVFAVLLTYVVWRKGRWKLLLGFAVAWNAVALVRTWLERALAPRDAGVAALLFFYPDVSAGRRRAVLEGPFSSGG